MNEYLVWFDLLLNDYFSIERSEMTKPLQEQLEKEGTIFHKVFADSKISAIEKQYPKSNRQYLPNEVNVSNVRQIMETNKVIH